MKKLRMEGVVICLVFFFFCGTCFAEAWEGNSYGIKLDLETINRGYTVSAFNDSLKLSLVPGVLNESTDVVVKKIEEGMNEPWKLDRISDIYQFEFLNKSAYDNHTPFYIQFSYDDLNDNYKKVFFFDKNFNTWRPLPTKDYPEERFVRSLIHLPYAKIAVFSYPEILTVGKASWYAYKPGMFTASPDYPKGSKLRIHNVDNGKYVDVVVNDYGPDRSIFPDRAVDLEKNAFAEIASLGAGTVNVLVEPLNILKDVRGDELGVSSKGEGSLPDVRVKAAIVVNEDSDEVLMKKEAASSLPLASLTKLVSAKIFLELKPDFKKEVTYKKQDEEYNYKFCKPWESSKIKLEEGDVLTVEDFFNSAVVYSANNSIESLVRVSGVSREKFISLMNEKVKEWGARDTYFVEPTGLSPENVSSAKDYALIVKNIFSDKIMQEVSAKKRYQFKLINRDQSFNLRNKNLVLNSNKFHFTGSKTGYLDEAGYCLMTRIKNVNGDDLIVVTFGAESREESFSEQTELMNFGLRKYKL